VSQGDLRKALEDGLKALKGYSIIDTTFKVPDEKFMMVRFLATANDAGVNRDGKKVWAKSINEFEARVFVLQVMLGQTIAKVKEIAMKVYDETIGKVMEKLAAIFSLTVAELTEVIEDYIDQTPSCPEAVPYGYTPREHFIHMYIGVVASIAVPLLCCTVLPLLLDDEDVSTEAYRKAVEAAKKDLGALVKAPPQASCGCSIQ